jgi:hypothetical protein
MAVIVACRVLGGICARVNVARDRGPRHEAWYRKHARKAITVIVSGNTLGLGIGMPVRSPPSTLG